ncbi:MAG: tyrosine-type recombinase/integrase [Nitrosotalea sp.]
METRKRLDIHNYQKRVKEALNYIKSCDLDESDKKVIVSFTDVLRSEGISLGRVAKYIYHLKTISDRLGQYNSTLAGADRKALEQFRIWLNEYQGYAPSTRRDFIITIKRFYQWLRAPPDQYTSWKRLHKYPPEVEDLSTTIKMHERFLPSELVTEDELGSLLKHTTHPMYAAFIALYDELGPRPGEILTMKIKDLIFDGTDLTCRLAGKTGERLVYLVKSVSRLTRWLEIHPFRDDPNAYLWLNLGNNKRYHPWSYAACVKILRKTAKEAGIKKEICPYIFRHSAASRDARLGFSESQLCLKYGWVLGSKMPRIYIHISGTALKDKIMEAYAGRQPEATRPQTVSCPRCGISNHPSQKYCSSCGSPIEPKEDTIRLEELKHEISEIKDILGSLLKGA